MMGFVDPNVPRGGGPFPDPYIPPWAMNLMGGGLLSDTQPPLLGGQGPTFQRSPVAPVPQAKPGFMAQMLNRLFPVPGPWQGLLSPEDLQAMQKRGLLDIGASLLESSGPVVGQPAPSLGQAIGRALNSGRQGFEQQLPQAIAAQEYVSQRQDAQAKKAAEQQRQEQRAAIMAKYPVNPNASPQENARMLQSLFNELIRVGDMEFAGRIGEVLKSQTDLLGGGKVPLPEFHNLPGASGAIRINPDGTTANIPYVAPERPERANRIITAVNPRTGQSEYAEVTEDGFKFTGVQPGTARDAASTESERRGAALLALASDAAPILDAADAPGRLQQFAAGRGLNEFLNAQQQINSQAGLVIADAYIRLTSGANAPEPEVQRTMKMITPLPGDTPEVIARKRQTRAAFMRALHIAAGRAAGKAAAPPAPKQGGRVLPP